MLDTPARAFGFAAAVATVVVGLIHAFNSFVGETNSLRWSSGGFFEEVNASWQENFLLTPYEVAKHWQPLLLGLLALGQHIAVVHVWKVYNSWGAGALFYLVLACFGCFGFSGNAGLIAGCISLVASFLSLAMAFLDREGASKELREPLFK